MTSTPARTRGGAPLWLHLWRALLHNLRWWTWIGARIQNAWARADERIRIANALPIGTRVRLICLCARRSEASRLEHAAVWTVSAYNADANDYRLVSDDAAFVAYEKARGYMSPSTYARRGALEIVQ